MQERTHGEAEAAALSPSSGWVPTRSGHTFPDTRRGLKAAESRRDPLAADTVDACPIVELRGKLR